MKLQHYNTSIVPGTTRIGTGDRALEAGRCSDLIVTVGI